MNFWNAFAVRTTLHGSLQMTDLSARVSFVASKVGLSVVEQNRLHTFRLTSNSVLNRQSEPSRENLLRDIKTLTFFVKRLTGEDIPAELYHQLPRADATYIVAPPAKERIRRMRVCFQYADDTFLYVLPVDTVADEPLRVRSILHDVVGTICWVLIAEIFPNTIRGKAVAIAVAFQWIFNYIISSTFPALYDFSPMFAYSLYGIICVAVGSCAVLHLRSGIPVRCLLCQECPLPLPSPAGPASGR